MAGGAAHDEYRSREEGFLVTFKIEETASNIAWASGVNSPVSPRIATLRPNSRRFVLARQGRLALQRRGPRWRMEEKSIEEMTDRGAVAARAPPLRSCGRARRHFEGGSTGWAIVFTIDEGPRTYIEENHVRGTPAPRLR